MEGIWKGRQEEKELEKGEKRREEVIWKRRKEIRRLKRIGKVNGMKQEAKRRYRN